MYKEYDLKKLKLKRRGPLQDLSDDKQAKLRTSLSLDQDVVAYFKAKAEQPAALPFDEQINQVLRQVMVASLGNQADS